MRRLALATAALLLLPAAALSPAHATPPGGQLITAEAPHAGATSGTVSWWERRGGRGRWVRVGSAPARFGAGGLVAGEQREQGTSTTPTGVYGLPYAFGIEPPPRGTSYPYRRVREDSWWCQDNASASYNRWVEPLPADCRADEAEHLVTYAQQYAYGLVVAFNYDRPVRGRGAGIFLHVHGKGATAGCVSVSREAMVRILRWVRKDARPLIRIGTTQQAR
ncbi:L,D-transpeptidase [Streptomyces sp. CC210A]|uniref:L,D-transpeptidase family protein n=1 Tax=Streptomyces sp. CC210A TaxID=2898184 RepID=UPI001F010B99|nr:L,D-transpeptidase family protein [Streptomyces sp. CC210A]